MFALSYFVTFSVSIYYDDVMAVMGYILNTYIRVTIDLFYRGIIHFNIQHN